VLPGINAQQRRELPDDRILVRVCADQHLARFVVFDEPGPAAALDAGQRGVELGFEGREVFVGGLDCCLFPISSACVLPTMCCEWELEVEVEMGDETNLQLPLRLSTTPLLARRKVLPE